MPTSFLKSHLKRFIRNTDGYVSTEAIIVLPIMLWLFGVGWVYFDAFRQQSVSQKANYVVGDMISRETDPVDEAYIGNAYSLLKSLTKSSSAETDMRTTVVQYDADRDSWDLVWSDAYGARSELQAADMIGYRTRLPSGADNEQLILVETWEDYEPAFEVGLGAFEIATFSFTSPRYAPQVVWGASNASGASGSQGENNDDDSTSSGGGTSAGNSGGGTSTGGAASGGGKGKGGKGKGKGKGGKGKGGKGKGGKGGKN